MPDKYTHSLGSQKSARVTGRLGDRYLLDDDGHEIQATVTGRFRLKAREAGDFPVPGDKVCFEMTSAPDEVRITALLPRQNQIARKMPISGGRKLQNGVISGGTTQEQVLAANVDIVFILSGLDGNYSLPRLERYLAMASHAKVPPVVLLTKADCSQELEKYLTLTREHAAGIPVHLVSAVTGEGMAQVREYLQPGRIVVFLGSSGVGKSTLLNKLLGKDVQLTHAVSEKTGKGRHTTTNRQLFPMPGGASVIDTPGIRELQLWVDQEDIDKVFAEITQTASRCRFSDCSHTREPGCAVRDGIQSGQITQDRLGRYRIERKELDHLHKRQEEASKKANRKASGNGH